MIAYDVGGVSDIVRDGRTGLLANPGDCSSLTLALESLLVNESLRLQMSNNCRSVAIDEFSLDLQADRYSALYSDILAP
jgi:glycosyltransferase involved in cell wall biosynthesis